MFLVALQLGKTWTQLLVSNIKNNVWCRLQFITVSKASNPRSLVLIHLKQESTPKRSIVPVLYVIIQKVALVLTQCRPTVYAKHPWHN